ncbi:short-chain dehydrogenase [Chryseobacterium glaciei]|uniref:Short-chain dehydrogenase n=1 Tax=Chryseobacterium glaciei TaxID=1685010 RepID=A0A172XZ67_9FLAO|nr:SDR family NAD(P)-dependent oxidoreductase [Chryseobacterium glaciei]ANF52244.1 short-chain dehydrogenase [Chryseobacterium glaciei]
MEIKGKTILITGGTAGIGLEAAKQFLAAGANVIITGRSQDKLDAAKNIYPALTIFKSDAANADDAQNLYNKIEEMGGIDILYNNAGVMGKPLNLGIADAKHFEVAANEMNINYLGVIRMNNLFIEMLKSRNEDAIINTSSLLSYVPLNLAPTYCASKVAVRFYTVSLRNHLQLIKCKVKVFELSPPVVATEMTSGIDQKSITPEKLVNALITGIRKDKFIIRVGLSKLLYIFSRLSPWLTFKILNPKVNASLLQA